MRFKQMDWAKVQSLSRIKRNKPYFRPVPLKFRLHSLPHTTVPCQGMWDKIGRKAKGGNLINVNNCSVAKIGIS
jgi:hypothetical protein